MVEQKVEEKERVGRKMTGQDQAVMTTSNDALTTKVSAEKLGYFTDPFCALFSRGSRKLMPIMNRGTWARVASIRQVVGKFLESYRGVTRVNIVSLGAGYDSTYWWLKESDAQIDSRLDWIEIDFPDVVSKKI